MSSADRKAFVAELERQHGERLRRFIASRLRHRTADVPDLVQEVYLRLLRMRQHETIRSSEAYLFTVAFQHVRRVLFAAGKRLKSTGKSCRMTPIPWPASGMTTR